MQWIQQSTATAILIGPFQSSTDGSVQTGLTVTSIDVDVYKKSDTHPLTKSDLTITASAGVNDMAHVANGYYSLELTTTDTNTVGRGRITANIAGSLPVWEDIQVLPSVAYGPLVAGSAGAIRVNVVEANGNTVAAGAIPNAAAGANGGLPTVDSSNRISGIRGTINNLNNLDAAITTLATAANLTTLLNRVGAFTGTGVNTVLGFMLAMLKSDASNPSDVGGTYDAATDAQQAIRDNHPASFATLSIANNATAANVTRVNGNASLAELAAGAPPATPTPQEALMFLYMALRNGVETTASEQRVKNDAGTVIFEMDLSYDGTTFTKGEARAAN